MVDGGGLWRSRSGARGQASASGGGEWGARRRPTAGGGGRWASDGAPACAGSGGPCARLAAPSLTRTTRWVAASATAVLAGCWWPWCCFSSTPIYSDLQRIRPQMASRCSWVLALQIRWLEGFRGSPLAGAAATPKAAPLGVVPLVGGFGEDPLPSTPPSSSGENLRSPCSKRRRHRGGVFLPEGVAWGLLKRRWRWWRFDVDAFWPASSWRL